jgi:hypothetical protein
MKNDKMILDRDDQKHGLRTPNEAFSNQTFGLGHTNWTDKFWGIFGGIISTILAV